MKNNVLKYYIAVFYFCSIYAMSAQPGDTAPDGLETDTDNTPPMPIDDSIWVLVLVGLLFAFIKFKAIQNKNYN